MNSNTIQQLASVHLTEAVPELGVAVFADKHLSEGGGAFNQSNRGFLRASSSLTPHDKALDQANPPGST